jgi:hypothetical protein
MGVISVMRVMNPLIWHNRRSIRATVTVASDGEADKPDERGENSGSVHLG